ncbi:MAG: TIGR03984 family CRISPR-associated protein [Synechococcales cyanobacterium RM1_1_8]|nr:TIGR03984 family CRISPR-associated protein [Synechococcales cyanobacterium RM1_1_8]
METLIKPIAKLLGQEAEGIELGDAIAAFQSTQAPSSVIGLIYSPQHCCFVRVDEQGKLEAYRGKSSLDLSLASIFEARLFTPQAELRWLKTTDPEQQDRAIVIAEDEIAELEGFKRLEQQFKQPFTPIQQSYVLWGEADLAPPALGEGWGMLATARIGRLSVPAPKSEMGEYVMLHSKEYLDCDECGNVFIAQERLTKLEWKAKEKQEKING